MLRAFFESHVRSNFEEWNKSPLDERLAKNAVADMNNMAARVYRHWEAHDLAKVYGATNEGNYRNELCTRECADFGIIRDVADAHKHFILDRRTRKLTRSDQTGPGNIGYGQGRYGEGVYGGGPQLVITLDDGTTRPLAAVMRNAMQMWEQLLTRWGL